MHNVKHTCLLSQRMPLPITPTTAFKNLIYYLCQILQTKKGTKGPYFDNLLASCPLCIEVKVINLKWPLILVWPKVPLWRHDTQHNGLICDTQHNRNECLYASSRFFIDVISVIILSVVMLNVAMLSVVVPPLYFVQVCLINRSKYADDD